jgi:hypothetical protein
MASTSSRYKFNPEDKINWEELAPSLQDKFKALWNSVNNNHQYLGDRIGDVRLTVGFDPPLDPIEYCELWFDTSIMTMRAYTDGKWTLTCAGWYGNSSKDVTSTDESRLSSNPRTNCHCYMVDHKGLQGDGFCHCKMQLWDSSTIQIGKASKISFNKLVEVPYSATDKYKWIITPSAPGVIIQTLNGYSVDNQSSYLIIPKDSQTKVLKNGEYVPYCDFPEQFDPLFDDQYLTMFALDIKYTIDVVFADKVKFGGIVGRLAPYSSGPVNIKLQAQNDSNWITIFEIALAGNPQYVTTCHRHCHCARW